MSQINERAEIIDLMAAVKTAYISNYESISGIEARSRKHLDRRGSNIAQ